MAHRVVLLLTLWIALWMGAGAVVGHLLFYTFWTGVVDGFVFAVLTTFLWPWIMPEAIDNWIDGVKA
jgi:hypothetical protein